MARLLWVGILGVAIATAATTTTSIMSAAEAAPKPSHAASHFALELDGQVTGSVRAVRGASLDAAVVDEPAFEGVELELGIGMGKEMYEWINASFDKGHARKDLAIIMADQDFETTASQRLEGAAIASVTVPKLDGSSKDAAYMRVHVEHEKLHFVEGSKRKLEGKERAAAKPAAGFRLSIGDLPCARVKKIDALTWSMKLERDEQGKLRKAAKSPKISPLRLSIDARDLEPWKQWQEAGGKKAATLTLLGPDASEELLTIEFSSVGIVSLARDDQEANSEKIARFNVELYVEKMTFKLSY
jgi:hypothetical protein